MKKYLVFELKLFLHGLKVVKIKHPTTAQYFYYYLNIIIFFCSETKSGVVTCKASMSNF